MQIAILTGGQSHEREIALKSAANVDRALTSKSVNVRMFDLPADLESFLSHRSDITCVIPVFHGPGGEDGMIQGFLETLNLPYIFSGVGAHAIGMNKAVTKAVVGSAGINSAQGQVITRVDSYVFTRPVVVKPLNSGSSVGVDLVRDQASLQTALDKAFAISDKVLVEALIMGQEFTVPVIEEQGIAKALDVIEIRSKKAFFDLESKYDPALCDELCPAPIDAALAQRLRTLALKAHLAIGARHVSRSDFIVDATGLVWFLEINTIPGMTDASLLPKALKVAGIDFGDLLLQWIKEVAA